MISQRMVLIYLAVKYENDYDLILKELTACKKYPEEEVKEVVNSLKCNVMTMVDDNYPNYLKYVRKPPIVLFYYGDINLISDYNKNIAIIGTRNPSEYGIKYTKIFAKELAKNYNIVGGLATGVHTIAHTEALNENGKTIAVLGSGIDNPYPDTNTKLYKEIIANGGLVISEYANNVQPTPERFVMRNRLIAQFSKKIIVSEATKKSGTELLVAFALNQGRDIMCIPTNLDSEFTLGNELICQGAMPILAPSNI